MNWINKTNVSLPHLVFIFVLSVRSQVTIPAKTVYSDCLEISGLPFLRRESQGRTVKSHLWRHQLGRINYITWNAECDAHEHHGVRRHSADFLELWVFVLCLTIPLLTELIIT